MNPLRSMLLAVLCAAPVVAGEWPQWLGPQRDGSSPETVPAWMGKLKELWRQPVGEGNGSPVVVGGRVFLHAKVKDKNTEEVVAFDSMDGTELWRTRYDRAAFTSLYGNGPRGTPAVADGKVYTNGITGVVTCFDAASGKIVWRVDTQKRFDAPKLVFGVAGSPLIDDGRVLLNVGAKGASIVALDAVKGETVWKSMDDPASYSSPIVLGDGLSRQVIFFTAKGVASLDPADGKPYWQFPLVDKLLESSTTPVKVGDRLLASAITYGSAALTVEAKDGKPAYAEAWKNPELTSYFSTPVAVGADHVYLVTGKNPLSFRQAEATLNCVDMKTGKKLWSKPKVGEYHAALLRTGDGKLLMLEEFGDLVLLQPDPKEYRELARAKVCGRTWAHPALANGKLYLRDDKDVVCIELPK